MSYNLSCEVSFPYLSWMVEMKRVAIKFYFKVGLSARETLLLVQKAYGNEALNRSNFLGGTLPLERRAGDQVTSCQDVIAMADADKNFSNKIITGR